jgi:carnitine-CoA ligase
VEEAVVEERTTAGGVPPRDRCVIPHLLEQGAREHPDRLYALFEDGSSWSYDTARAAALQAATGLAELGVGAGDTVLSWLPNGADALRVWFGANQLGAVYVPINTAYRGRLLEHVIDNSGARFLVVHADLVPRLQGIRLGRLEHVIVVGPPTTLPSTLTGHTAQALTPSHVLPRVVDSPAEPWDPYAIIYTSGTTGPSKGVVSSYVHLHASAMAAFDGRLTAGDRYMVNLPLFHAGGTIGVLGALVLGGSIAVVSAFDTVSFWDVVRRTETTSCTLLGVMATFLAKQAASPAHREHGLRTVFMVPLAEDARTFADRFGVDVYTLFNMTEVSCPLVSERNPAALGSCGRPRAGVDARLVDEHDRDVAAGQTGELILRTDCPWAMNSGYHRNPEATASAWRNGWFHTGDAFRVDADGNHYFVDRIKDAIRRRGENISSFEVEAEIVAHPAVQECAAVAVTSEHGEDDVLAVVAPVPGATLDPAELIAFLVPRMPHFMVPRYIRIVDELPKTPTSKVEKHLLRQQGVTDQTWDRERAGISVRREHIGSAR